MMPKRLAQVQPNGPAEKSLPCVGKFRKSTKAPPLRPPPRRPTGVAVAGAEEALRSERRGGAAAVRRLAD